MSLRVLQCLPQLNSGGVERGTLDMCRHLIEQGHTAYVASAGGRWVEKLEELGAYHWQLPLHRKDPISLLINAFRLRRLIRRHNIDVVHGRSRAPAWSAYWATRRLTTTRWLTTFHGLYGLKPWLIKRFYNHSMVTGEKIIAVSQFIADHVRRHYHVPENRITVIHRGVDTRLFDPTTLDDGRLKAADRLCQWQANRVRVLVPARITRWKGQLHLFNHIAALPNALRNRFDFVLCGQVNHANCIQELNAMIDQHQIDNVRFAGHGDDMPALYASAELIIALPTRPEAFGRIPIEAGAMQRLIIASGTGGLCESILQGETGWLVDPQNHSAFEAALQSYLDCPEPERLKRQTQARQHIVDNFSVDKMCSSTLNLYQHLVKS